MHFTVSVHQFLPAYPILQCTSLVHNSRAVEHIFSHCINIRALEVNESSGDYHVVYSIPRRNPLKYLHKFSIGMYCNEKLFKSTAKKKKN
jgi:hypothetical protein